MSIVISGQPDEQTDSRGADKKLTLMGQKSFDPKSEYGETVFPHDISISKWSWVFPKDPDPGAVCSCCGRPYVNLTTIIVSVEGHLLEEGMNAGRAGYGVWFGDGNTWNLSGRLDAGVQSDLCCADTDSTFFSESKYNNDERITTNTRNNRTLAVLDSTFQGPIITSSQATLIALDAALHRLHYIRLHCPQITRAIIKISDSMVSQRLLDPQAQQRRAVQSDVPSRELAIHGDGDAEGIGTPKAFFLQLLDCRTRMLAAIGMQVEWWEVKDWFNQEAGILISQAINAETE